MCDDQELGMRRADILEAASSLKPGMTVTIHWNVSSEQTRSLEEEFSGMLDSVDNCTSYIVTDGFNLFRFMKEVIPNIWRLKLNA